MLARTLLATVVSLAALTSTASAQLFEGFIAPANSGVPSQDQNALFGTRAADDFVLVPITLLNLRVVRDFRVRIVKVVMIGNTTPTVGTFGLNIHSNAVGSSGASRPGTVLRTVPSATSVQFLGLANLQFGSVFPLRKYLVTFTTSAPVRANQRYWVSPFARAGSGTWSFARSAPLLVHGSPALLRHPNAIVGWSTVTPLTDCAFQLEYGTF